MGWGANDIERLRALAAAGLSASQIAREMGDGRSRSSIISKLYRLGTPLIRPHGCRTIIARPAPAPQPQSEPIAVKPEPTADQTAPVSTLNLKAGVCRWPVNDGKPEWLHCGAPARGVYCDQHRARAFNKPRERAA